MNKRFTTISKPPGKGIKVLPDSSKLGVYVAYIYYMNLFKRIRNRQTDDLFEKRIRVPNYYKVYLMMTSFMRYKFRLV